MRDLPWENEEKRPQVEGAGLVWRISHYTKPLYGCPTPTTYPQAFLEQERKFCLLGLARLNGAQGVMAARPVQGVLKR